MNEKENTVRALTDQTSLVSSLWCYFGIHNYTKWSQPTRSGGSAYVRQERLCSKCGKYSHRKTSVL